MAIGKTINRTPQSVRVKCAELGIKLKKPSAKNVLHVSMDRDTRERLQADATERGMTANELLRLLIAQIVSDQLYNAVIDSPPAPRRAMSAFGGKADMPFCTREMSAYDPGCVKTHLVI